MSVELIIKNLPIWNGDISMLTLKGGLSNAAYLVKDDSGDYVVRAGKDYPFHFVDRGREAAAARAAFDVGLSPEVTYIADGIMVLRHVEAATFTENDVRQNWLACTDLIKRCHRDMLGKVQGDKARFWVFDIIRKYAVNLRELKHRSVPYLNDWLDINDSLETAQAPLPEVFGHHDLLPGNFLKDEKRLWLIDWEYGGVGTAMFDLANLATASNFSEELEQAMLREYFGTGLNEALQRGYAAMKVASTLREALWGMTSEIHLNVPGVDYIAYSNDYIGRFKKAHLDYKSNFG